MKDTNKLITEVIDHLTFSSYANNRKLNPEISPSRWGKIYGEKEVALMEKTFQNTLTTAKK